MILIIVIVLIITFLLFILISDDANCNDPFIYFLNEDDINYFIMEDYDDYIKNLSDADLSARGQSSDLDYQLNIVNNIYNLNNQEKLFMTNKIKIAHKLLKKEKYYLDPNIIDKISWNIAFIKNDILENAFPHTRDDIIFLSSLDLNQTNEYMIETLIHEFIHIYQRKFPDVMKKYLKDNEYRFIRTSTYKDNIRSNPDIDNKIYELDGRIMIASYNSLYPININDCINRDFEHPNEIMADSIARSLINKYY